MVADGRERSVRKYKKHQGMNKKYVTYEESYGVFKRIKYFSQVISTVVETDR